MHVRRWDTNGNKDRLQCRLDEMVHFGKSAFCYTPTGGVLHSGDTQKNGHYTAFKVHSNALVATTFDDAVVQHIGREELNSAQAAIYMVKLQLVAQAGAATDGSATAAASAEVAADGSATTAASTAHAEAHAEAHAATEGVSEGSFSVASPPTPLGDEVCSACLSSSCRPSLHATLTAATCSVTLALAAAAA